MLFQKLISANRVVSIVNTPNITSPTSGSTGIFNGATLTSSAYAVTGVVGTHLNTDWEIYSNSSLATLVTSSMASTTNLTTWTPTGLGYSTQYWARVRYRSSDAIVSDWSATVSWTTGVEPGVTWVYRAQLSTTTWGTTDVADMVWNGTQFLVGAGSGAIATSSDGITWTYRTALTNGLTCLIWAGSQYIAGQTAAGVATSPDGITWTNRTGSSGTATATSIAWNGSLYVIVGLAGKSATSPDGINWTSRTSLSTVWASADANSIIWSGTQFVAGGAAGKIATSSDGITWTNRTQLSTTTWGTAIGVIALNWNGTQYLAIGDSSGRAATSTDGITWTYQSGFNTAYGAGQARLVEWNGTQYIASGGPSGRMATSPDGITWTNRPQLNTTTWGSVGGASEVFALAWGNSRWVAGGRRGRIATSTT